MEHPSAACPPPCLASPPDAATRQPSALLTPQQEARAFWRMRRRTLRTLLAQTFSRGRFRLAIILLFSLLLWTALYLLFFMAFAFLGQAIPSPELHDQTIQLVFGMFFMTLMVMLVLSTAILLYSSLFLARDVPLLLTLPARAERVFVGKFQDAVVMSSWAFVLLGSPMLLAYGVVVRAPWQYFAELLPFLIAFVCIPAGVGAVACLVVVHRLPRRRIHVLAMACAVVLAGGAWLLFSAIQGNEGNLLTPTWFEQMFNRLKIAENRLLPSWWLSAGLLQAARAEPRQAADSVMLLVVMISNALAWHLVAVWTAARTFRPAYSGLHGRHGGGRKARVAWIDRATAALTRILSPQVRVLMLKDLRLFRRDPVQWSQFLIFFGLLALYFINIRRFTYDVHYAGWVNVVSFLNVSVVGLLLSTFTTRFIFPMISLEGRRFWVLGLLPVRRETILWSKFAFAVGASILPCSLLILLSDLMLSIDPSILASHQVTCVILCFGLSGIAVGLGARMPSLREQSPSRIAAGFGGTLNLVLSTLYILAVVVLTAVPSHFYLGGYSPGTPLLLGGAWLAEWIRIWFIAGSAISVLLGLVATVVPLVIGFRAFRKTEF